MPCGPGGPLLHLQHAARCCAARSCQLRPPCRPSPSGLQPDEVRHVPSLPSSCSADPCARLPDRVLPGLRGPGHPGRRKKPDHPQRKRRRAAEHPLHRGQPGQLCPSPPPARRRGPAAQPRRHRRPAHGHGPVPVGLRQGPPGRHPEPDPVRRASSLSAGPRPRRQDQPYHRHGKIPAARGRCPARLRPGQIPARHADEGRLRPAGKGSPA